MKLIFKASILLATTILIGCNINNDKRQDSKKSIEDKNLSSALIKGYFIQEKGISICIYQNTIYLLTDAKTGFDNNKFLLHYIDSDRNFLNRDFYKNNYEVNDSLFTKYKNLRVLKIPLLEGDFESIRIGQFVRNENNQTNNIWAKEIGFNDINNRKSFYKNELNELLPFHLLKNSFEHSLLHNTFFKTSENLYILYENDFIYFIAPNEFPTKNKFMLHFINEENTFLNHSFFFEQFEFQNYIEKEVKIARVPIPSHKNFYKIRIGQFNSDGNIWAQEFIPEKLNANPILRYDGEFSLFP